MAVLRREAVLIAKALAAKSQVAFKAFIYYGKVELTPPKLSDIPTIKNGISKGIESLKSGQYRELTVREAWLNTLVAAEVLCWFFVGECIGKRHLVGYKV